MITKIENELLPDYANPSACMCAPILKHLNMQGDKINELIDAVNQLENKSTDSSESNIGSIDANEFKSAIKEICDKYSISYGDCYGGFGEALSKVIDEALSIKEPTNHRWIYDGRDSDYTKYYKCSCCKYVVLAYRDTELDYKFCPYCGTKLVRK